MFRSYGYMYNRYNLDSQLFISGQAFAPRKVAVPFSKEGLVVIYKNMMALLAQDMPLLHEELLNVEGLGATTECLKIVGILFYDDLTRDLGRSFMGL